MIALGGTPGKVYEVSPFTVPQEADRRLTALDLGIANRVALVMGASKGIGRADGGVARPRGRARRGRRADLPTGSSRRPPS